jgi:predicted nucleic acid-binding protein
MKRAVRVVLDVNILVGNIIAHDRGHKGTAMQTLVSMVSSHSWGFTDKAQLVISFEMIDTLELVLRRMQVTEARIKAYSNALIDVMRYGPDGLDPYLILGGEERFAMSDVEDVGVLATAVGARADLLVTDNLRDFVSKDADIIDTQFVNTASGSRTLRHSAIKSVQRTSSSAIRSMSCAGFAWAMTSRPRRCGAPSAAWEQSRTPRDRGVAPQNAGLYRTFPTSIPFQFFIP